MYISPLVCGRLFPPNHLLWLPYILLAGYTQQDRMLLTLPPRRHTYYLFCIPNPATTCILLLSSRLHTQTSFRMEPPQPQVLPQTYTQHPRTRTRQSPSVGSSKQEESFKLFQTESGKGHHLLNPAASYPQAEGKRSTVRMNLLSEYCREKEVCTGFAGKANYTGFKR